MKRQRDPYEEISYSALCEHKNSFVIKLGSATVSLSCCQRGHSCKERELKRLAEKCIHYFDEKNLAEAKALSLRNSLVSKASKIMELERELAEVKASLKTLESMPVSTVNNYNYTDNRQVNITNNIIGDQAMGLFKDGLDNKNIFTSAVDRLKLLPDTPEKKRLLQLAQSSDLSDVLNFRREIIETLQDKLPECVKNSETSKRIDSALVAMNEEISKEAKIHGIVEEVD